MKSAFSTVACMGSGWKSVLAWAAAAWQDAVEIRLESDGSAFGASGDGVKEIADGFRQAGIAISDIGTSIRFSEYSEEALKRAEQAAALAEQLGAVGIRVFPGSFVKRFSEKPEHDLVGMARFLRRASEIAESHGAQIWIETHNEFSAGKAMRRLLDLTDRPNVKVIWDLIHPFEYGDPPEETLKYLGGFIAHVHVKDGKKPDDPDRIDWTYTKLGEGGLPIKRMLDLLEGSGYSGYYSLEWENAWRPEIRNIYRSMPELLSDWNAFLTALRN